MDKTIEQMRQDLARSPYAVGTQTHYVKSALRMAAHFGRDPADVTRDEIRGYIDHLASRGRSASWLKTEYAALVFLFRKTLGRPDHISFVSWPRQRSALPTVLSLDETKRLLDAITHPRYQAIAMVMYATGLRIAEALAIQVRDIDGPRGVLHVRCGKGGRPRTVPLSSSLHGWLREYWAKQRPPTPFLFASHRTNRPPQSGTVVAALHRAAEEAGIHKHVTPHVLRHSFATHLLENGTDVRVIQAMLGHASINTTARYTRVATHVIKSVPSPLDLLPTKPPR